MRQAERNLGGTQPQVEAMMAQVSVMFPVFNAGQQLPIALASPPTQDHADLEHQAASTIAPGWKALMSCKSLA